MKQNIVLSWLQETIQRLFTKSPKFFIVWTIVSTLLVLITGLPDFLASLEFLNIHIPNLWNDKVTAAVAWASRAMLFMSLLTTQSKAETVTKEGVVLKKTDETKLPFTSQAEVKKAQIEQVPNSSKTLEEVKQ